MNATVLSSTEIFVNWMEDQNKIIIQYEVMYEPLMTFGGLITTLTVNTTNLSITLMDLEEYVEYSISVRAYTIVGPGPYIVGIVRRTFEDGTKGANAAHDQCNLFQQTFNNQLFLCVPIIVQVSSSLLNASVLSICQ